MAGTTSTTGQTGGESTWWRAATWVTEALPRTVREAGQATRRLSRLATWAPPRPGQRAPTLREAMDRLSASLDRLGASTDQLETAAHQVVAQAQAAADPSARQAALAVDQAHFVTMYWQIRGHQDEAGRAAWLAGQVAGLPPPGSPSPGSPRPGSPGAKEDHGRP
jgi:outer membrane murein-binding lipoprotein Lpp